MVGAAARARAIGNHFAAMIGVSPADRAVEGMLYSQTAGRLGCRAACGEAAQAVASAIRHLSEREAWFDTPRHLQDRAQFRAADNHRGCPGAGDEARGAPEILVAGTGEADRFMTTAQAIRIEQQILDEVEAGRGARHR